MNQLWICLERASAFGLAALAVALLLQWLLARRVPASWRVWLWRAALIQTALALIPLAPLSLALLPPRAPVAAPNATLALAPSQTLPLAPPSVLSPSASRAEIASPREAHNTAPPPLEPPPTSLAIDPSPARPLTQTPSASLALTPPTPASFDWRALLLAVYALGAAFQLALLARGAVRVRRVLAACRPLEDAAAQARLRALEARLQIPAPRLWQSASGAPFLAGIFRPTIVLPRGLDEAHLEAVLAHELAHQLRRDLTWNAVMWALQTTLWFHPLTWAARRFHALEVESACDELTLQLTPIAPRFYGALLLQSMNKGTCPLTAGVNDGFFALKTRLKRLGRAPQSPRRRVRVMLVAALLLSFGAVVPLRLVSRAQTVVEAEETTIATQPVTGVVVAPWGSPLAGALISVEGLDVPGDIGVRGTTRSDAKGRFIVPANWVGRPAQLFASTDQRASLHGAIVQGGDEVTLVLNSQVLATIQGQTRETKTQRPLPNIIVSLYRKIDSGEMKVASTQSDSKGAFRFSDLRPFQNYFMRFESQDYYRLGESIDVQNLSGAMTSKFGVSMEETTSKLRGRLLRADGSPAAGYGISVVQGLNPQSGQPQVRTRNDGKFFFDHLVKGKTTLRIREPGAEAARFFKVVPTGEPGIISIRLNKAMQLASKPAGSVVLGGVTSRIGSKSHADSKAGLLVGQVAPQLRVRPEGSSPSLQSLRGQTVMLCFKPYSDLSPVVGNFALSYQKRGVRVICVQNLPIIADKLTIAADGKMTYESRLSPDETAKRELRQLKGAREFNDLPIDVAFDLPRSTDLNSPNFGGQSAALYRNARYAVIGRAGKVLYAGDQLDRAITVATGGDQPVPPQSKRGAANRAPHDVSGTVRDFQDQPLAGATVYAIPMRPDGKPLQTARTNARGKFTLRGAKRGDLDMRVFADAGARGLGGRYVYGDSNDVEIKLEQPAQIALTFLDNRNQPVPNLGVSLRAVGASPDARMDMPDAVRRSFRATTDARGRASLGALPRGMVALFSIGQKPTAKPQFSQLSPTEDTVTLNAPTNEATIRLVPTVALAGHVALPDGQPASGFGITARRITAAEARGETRHLRRARARLLPHNRALRPGLPL